MTSEVTGPACIECLAVDLCLCARNHLLEPVVLDTAGQAQPLVLL